jgi:ribosomal-protein-alanine N-acetyltransferase
MTPGSDGVVQLRAWTFSDADWYAETAAHDELIQRFTGESPTLTSAEVREAIEDLLATGLPGFLIADAVTGDRLGNIALSHEDGVGEFHLWLAEPARGRGLAARAIRLLETWACEQLDLSEFQLMTRADNTRSRAVAERAGFVRHPERDKTRELKGETHPWVAYRKPISDR